MVLVGDLGGTIAAGQVVCYPLKAGDASKPGDYAKAFYGPPSQAAMSNPLINALYCTLLHAVGAPRDTFNRAPGLKEKSEQFGPLSELLA
jgi:hypothetical protein